MGAVHGVHLKYAFASALCCYGALGRTRAFQADEISAWDDVPPSVDFAFAILLWQAAAVHALRLLFHVLCDPTTHVFFFVEKMMQHVFTRTKRKTHGNQ